MSAGCSYCGAPVRARTEGGMARSVNAWSSTRYECGTESHSDGVERSAECRRREEGAKFLAAIPTPDAVSVPAVLVADAEPVPAPAGLLGDMTALALSANIRGMTVEGVHQSVTEICKRYGLEPRSSDREKVIQHCNDLSLAITLTRRPDIKDDALDALLGTLRDDIRNRINLLATETKENA